MSSDFYEPNIFLFRLLRGTGRGGEMIKNVPKHTFHRIVKFNLYELYKVKMLQKNVDAFYLYKRLYCIFLTKIGAT